MKKDLIHEYDFLCQDIAEKFIKVYFCEHVDRDPIGGQVDGCWMINDYFVVLQDMVTALRHGVPSNTFFDWYDYCVDEKEPKMNLYHFHKKREGDNTTT
jgi:hypothetical protein